MSKEIVKSNPRVVINHRRPTFSTLFINGEDSLFKLDDSICQEIAEQAERHCDNIQNAYVDYDIEYVCSFCKCTYEPECCELGDKERQEKQ